MKTKKHNISLRELFKRKLNDAEILPDASVKSVLMRRVARKEFMRFNPSRFNIYYLGGILISGITAAVILFSGSENSDHLKPLSVSGKLNNNDTSRYIQIGVEQPVRKKSNKSNISRNESIKGKVVSKLSDVSAIDAVKTTESQINNNSFPTGIRNSLSKKELFADASADKKKLKGGFKPDEILIETSASEGCAPMKLRFYNKSASYDSCRWTFGD